MAVAESPPKEAFHIDQLWNDSRYRSSFIQIVALILVLLAVLYLFNNVVENLAALGKTFGFSFMTQPAGYDINQRLIDYTSRSTHSTAAVVGIINTLLVALFGCLLATAIGVVAGVLRLSKNWIVSRLMTVYIEGIRNIPVLIQILLFAAVFDEALPAPSAFRGENATASMWFFDTVAATNRGFYFPAPVLEDGASFMIGLIIVAIIAAVIFGRWATQRQQETGEMLPVFRIKMAIIFGGALVAYLVSGMPVSWSIPELRGFNFQGGLYARNSYMALTLALAIYTGAFIAENVRAGIMAVSKGQTEAAFALGLQPSNTMSLVILPQALRVIIPPLISQYLNLTKNSSLALLVGYMDATGTLGGITLNQTGKEFETLGLLMAFYLSVSLSIAAVMNLYNEQVKLVERTSGTGFGISVLHFMPRLTQWETLKKGDAIMQPAYGIRRELNLYVLFYAALFGHLINYVFLAEITPDRPSYFDWTTTTQIMSLLMIVMSFACLITCIFKNASFINFVALEAIVFVIAVLVGWPFAAISPVDPTTFIAGTLAIRFLIFGYTVYAPRPNLTFFHRVPKGA